MSGAPFYAERITPDCHSSFLTEAYGKHVWRCRIREAACFDKCASLQSETDSPKTPLDSVPIDIAEALKAMGEAAADQWWSEISYPFFDNPEAKSRPVVEAPGAGFRRMKSQDQNSRHSSLDLSTAALPAKAAASLWPSARTGDATGLSPPAAVRTGAGWLCG